MPSQCNLIDPNFKQVYFKANSSMYVRTADWIIFGDTSGNLFLSGMDPLTCISIRRTILLRYGKLSHAEYMRGEYSKLQ